jgi:hypothetical protein
MSLLVQSWYGDLPSITNIMIQDLPCQNLRDGPGAAGALGGGGEVRHAEAPPPRRRVHPHHRRRERHLLHAPGEAPRYVRTRSLIFAGFRSACVHPYICMMIYRRCAGFRCEQGRACPALLPPAVQGVHDGDEEAAEGAQRRRRRQDAVAQDGQDQAGAVQQQAPRVQEILVLYTNYGKQRKPENNWVMHQYHLGSDEEERDGELVVSKVFFQTHPRQCGYTMARESDVVVPAAAAVTGSSNAFIAGHHQSGGGGSSVLREANGGADQLYSPGAMMGYDQGGLETGHLLPLLCLPTSCLTLLSMQQGLALPLEPRIQDKIQTYQICQI